MSSKPAKPAEAAPAPAPSGGKKKGLLIIVLAVLLLVALGGGAAWYFLGHKKADATADEGGGESGSHKADKKKKKGAEKPIFVTLESVTVNLSDPGAEHFMQIGIDLKVADAHVADDIKLHMPEIRNGLLLLLSSKKSQDVSTVDGKNQLRAEIREVVNKPLGVNTPAPKPSPEVPAEPGKEAGKEAVKKVEAFEEDSGVVDVLLTSMVIQ
jgi:flagellar FliL protein